MNDLSIALPEPLVDLIVERVAARIARQAAPQSEPWIGVEEAAAHLSCRRQRIYDLVSRRQISGIPHRKEGARLLFKRSPA